MNTTVTSFSSEHSWLAPGSRRGSIESILSIQGKETDFVQDTSDTDAHSHDERDLEYEPVTEPEDEGVDGVVGCDSSGESDRDVIRTKVIEVKVGDDGDLVFADSEQSDSDGSDSEIDLFDYWQCAQCRTENNNPLYRYCQKCFQVRKNFFPPRPRPKQQRSKSKTETIPISVHHLTDSESTVPISVHHLTDSETTVPISVHHLTDSGIDSQFTSQELSQTSDREKEPLFCSRVDSNSFNDRNRVDVNSSNDRNRVGTLSNKDSVITDPKESMSKSTLDLNLTDKDKKQDEVLNNNTNNSSANKAFLKRRAESEDRNQKRLRIDYSESDTESSDNDRSRKSKSLGPVSPLMKTVSDPSLTIDIESMVKKDDNMCIICVKEPKSGVFVHGRIAHICCCYKCAMKVWSTSKRCPVCNSKVSNVLKAVVM